MKERILVFVGSYAEAEFPGIYVYAFNEQSGQLTKLDEVSGIKNPTFLNVDIDRLKLYAIGEQIAEGGTRLAEAVSFNIDPSTGKLALLNRRQSLDAPTCHIQRDRHSRYLIVSSYHGGQIGLVAVREDGQVGERLDAQQHYGYGPHPDQNQPHPHSAFFSPDERYIYVSDLGTDCVQHYTIDPERNILILQGKAAVPTGSGPRHLTFHPNGCFVYVINELNSTVSVFSYNILIGTLQLIENVSTLPDDFTGENACAEITISEDGKFLYGSNRGHDSIVVYKTDPHFGTLTRVEHICTKGCHPRHFALTPGGKYLLAANRDTNNITVFQADGTTGKLKYTGQSVQVSKPVYVQPVVCPR